MNEKAMRRLAQPKTTITARLHKDGVRILCGRRGPDGGYICGEKLMDVLGCDLPEEITSIPGAVKWGFAPGWVPGEDGIWHLSEHARANWQRDREAASVGDQRAQQRLSTGTALQNRRSS